MIPSLKPKRPYRALRLRQSKHATRVDSESFLPRIASKVDALNLNSVSHVHEHASLDSLQDSMHAGSSVDEGSPYKHNKAFHCFISKFRRDIPKFYDKRRFLNRRFGT